MCRRDAGVEPNLFEVYGADAARGLVDLLQPGAEAKEDHAAPFEPAGFELDRAAGDSAIGTARRLAGLLAEVERQDRGTGRVTRRQRQRRH
jgi:hypothetical protein